MFTTEPCGGSQISQKCSAKSGIGKGRYPALERVDIQRWKGSVSNVGKGRYPALESLSEKLSYYE